MFQGFGRAGEDNGHRSPKVIQDFVLSALPQSRSRALKHLGHPRQASPTLPDLQKIASG
jgi:hypothetical protein